MFSGTTQDVDETVERRDGKKEKDKGYVAFYSDDDDIGAQGDDESLAASSSSIRFAIDRLRHTLVTFAGFKLLYSCTYRSGASLGYISLIVMAIGVSFKAEKHCFYNNCTIRD